MASVTCVDGSVLSVVPVPVLDRDGVPYEVTLRLLRDGAPFGEVGERCGWFLSAAAERLRAARAEGGPDALPAGALEAGLRSWLADTGDADTGDPDTGDEAHWDRLQRYLPRDRELFAFLARDPDDLGTAGELRVRLRDERTWVAGRDGGRGHWRLVCRAVLDAWGAGGTGVRAVLDSTALLALLEAVEAEVDTLGPGREADLDLRGARRSVG